MAFESAEHIPQPLSAPVPRARARVRGAAVKRTPRLISRSRWSAPRHLATRVGFATTLAVLGAAGLGACNPGGLETLGSANAAGAAGASGGTAGNPDAAPGSGGIPQPGYDGGPAGSGGSGAAGGAGEAGTPGSADYPFFTPAAYFNKPLAYWDLQVDPEATSWLVQYVSTNQPCVSIGAYPIYWVHDGDPDVREYTIMSDYTGSLVPWKCGIAGSASTYRIPAYAQVEDYADVTGHDRHLFVIDVDRNLVLTLYSWNATMGPIAQTSQYRTTYAGCDVFHGDDAKILAAETSRWTADGDTGWGVKGIGSGIGLGSTTNGGDSIGGAIMPEDFSVPGDDLGHVLTCSLSESYQDGITWPALGYDGSVAGYRIGTGTLIRIDPAWAIPAAAPAWEARILRTWQHYGCMIDDGGSSPLAMRAQSEFSGPNGSDPWIGVLPDGIIHHYVNDSMGTVYLPDFPSDRLEVMMPKSPVFQGLGYDMPKPSGYVQPTPPQFILSNSGSLSLAAGQSGSIALTATLVAGPSQTLAFSISGLPNGVTASYSPGSCTPPASSACAVDLTVTTDASVPPGRYTIEETASGAVTRTTVFNLFMQ